MDFNTLSRLRKYLSVKHHVPGRIRVKFQPAMAEDPLVRQLAGSDRGIPDGVSNVRLNSLARSVVIEYDHGRIPPDMLEELVSTPDDARAGDLLRSLNDILQTVKTKEEN